MYLVFFFPLFSRVASWNLKDPVRRWVSNVTRPYLTYSTLKHSGYSFSALRFPHRQYTISPGKKKKKEKKILYRNKTSLSIPIASHRNLDKYVINHASHNNNNNKKTPKKKRKKECTATPVLAVSGSSPLHGNRQGIYLPEGLRVDH